MAVFDAEQQKIVVRIVYDGPGHAGKTTNLKQLRAFFTALRRSELVVPEEVDGRTLWFDWMHIDGGLVGGHPLRCEFVSVPGQAAYAPRRWHLARTADAIVFVCDSDPTALDEARSMLAALRAFVAELGAGDGARDGALPVIVQANKQDQDGALAPEALLDALGMPPDTPVIGARASESLGVRETAVLAIRAAANAVQRALIARGKDALSGRQETPDEVLAALRALETRPLVEPAAPDPVDARAEGPEREARAGDDVAGDARPHAPSAHVPEAEAPPSDVEPVLLLVSPSMLPEAVDAAWSSPPPPREHATTDARGDARQERRDAAAPWAANDADLATAETIAPRATTKPPPVTPPLPRADVTSGWIWPAHGGRDTLKRVESTAARLRPDLVGAQGTADGSGSSDAFIYEAGDHCLKTSLRRRFDDVEEARAALVRLARAKIALGAWTPPGTTLSLQGDAAGAVWLWTVAPWMRTLRADMRDAEVRGDERALGDALLAWARAAIGSVALAARQHVVVDVGPSNFARRGGDLFYLDDDVTTGTQLPAIGHALLRRVDEYAAHAAAVRRYVDAVTSLVTTEITADDRAAVALAPAIADAYVSSRAGRDARAALLAAIDAADRARA